MHSRFTSIAPFSWEIRSESQSRGGFGRLRPQRIITGQLAGSGQVKVFSSGSGLTAGPAMYMMSPNNYAMNVPFAQVASFVPFAGSGGRGVRLATTSTVYGADVLVSGSGTLGSTVERYQLARASSTAQTLKATELTQIDTLPGNAVPGLGGD
jgi:hypothetical protein